MALKTFVMVSGVNNLSDARYCAGMGVDLLGFDLNTDHSGFVTPETFKEITDWISGVGFVAEFNESTIEQIINQVRHYKVDYLQTTNPALIHKLKPLGIPIILKFEVSRILSVEVLEALMQEYRKDVAFFTIENDVDNDDKTIFESIVELAKKYPILLGFGISEDNIESIVKEHSFKGVILKGGEEIKPGYKDFDELAGILEAIEVDDLEA